MCLSHNFSFLHPIKISIYWYHIHCCRCDFPSFWCIFDLLFWSHANRSNFITKVYRNIQGQAKKKWNQREVIVILSTTREYFTSYTKEFTKVFNFYRQVLIAVLYLHFLQFFLLKRQTLCYPNLQSLTNGRQHFFYIHNSPETIDIIWTWSIQRTKI